MGTFNECCPHCSAKLDLHAAFEAKDYSTEFYLDCPKCEKRIECIVHTVPEFEVFKPRCQRCSKQLTAQQWNEAMCTACFKYVDDHHAAMVKSMKGTP